MLLDIILALITTGTAGTAIKYAYEALQSRRKQKAYYSSVLEHIHEIYTILNKLVRDTHAARIVILKKEEEKIGLFGKRQTSTVIYEAYEYPLDSIKKKWQRQLIDDSYIRVLKQLEEKGEVELMTDQMEDGQLKTLYLSGGVKKAIVSLLSVNPIFIYISFNYSKIENEDLLAIDTKRYCINELRTIFEQFKV